MKKILAILQNQWFRDPDRVQALYDETPDLRNELIKRFLFMGCLTGRRLKAALGEELCDRIIWEEASPKIAGAASGAFPADVDHIVKAIDEHQPDVIVAFGKIACDGLQELGRRIEANPRETLKVRKDIAILYAPHPASRSNPMPRLKALAEELREVQ